MTHYYSDVLTDSTETSTSDTFLAAPTWANAVSFDSPTDFEWAFAAKIRDILVYDDSAGTYDRSEMGNVLDNGESGGILTLDSFEGGADFLYIGVATRFKSIYFDVSAANGTASVGTLKYRKNDGTWADISETDGTISTGATLGQDGAMTFTIPSDWDSIEQEDGISQLKNGLYYVRWEAATTLDAEVEVAQIIAGSRTTGYADVNDGNGVLNQGHIIPFDVQKVGGVLVKGAADTPLVQTTWYGNY
jgi:hypothetical protein